MSMNRSQALYLLRAHGIACIVWFEDAIAYYGVPTGLFDLHVYRAVWDPHPQREMGHLGFWDAEIFLPVDPARLVLAR